MRLMIPQNLALRMAAIGCGYFALAALTILWTRFDGGLAHIWASAALLTAQFMRTDARDWWRAALPCAIGSVVATSLFGFGPAAAAPLAVANIMESVIGAGLLRLIGRRDDYLATLPNVSLFMIAAGGIAPLVSGLCAATAVTWLTGRSFLQLESEWFAGHALGMLVFAPVMTMILRNELGEWARALSLARRIEAVGLFAAMIGVCLLAFGQERFPLLFLPMLPMIIITFRLDRIGAAIAVVVLVFMGAGLTAIGHGPINTVPGTVEDHSLFLQIYLAVSVLTVLPAAAELKQRKDIFRQLRESEARFKLITENASDIVVELDARGIMRYASPSVRELTGFAPEQLVGHMPHKLLSGPDTRTFLAAHRDVRDNPGLTSTVEYRAEDAAGVLKWFEAKTRGIIDDHGILVGSISAIRDISHRKTLEMRLAHAATTDSLTGLGNRRAFDALLDRRIEDQTSGAPRGCVAIFDLDFFKRVNDQHGHAVGDQVLANFATTALRIVRTNDYVARLGGEEFGIILDGVDLAQAERICDRLRDAVAHEVTRVADGNNLSVTASAGIAAIRPGNSRDQIMMAADAALYSAKAAGRDRLAIAA